MENIVRTFDEQNIETEYIRDKVEDISTIFPIIPCFEELQPERSSMTKYDMLQYRAEHGLWYAIDMEDENQSEMEIGVICAWRSDGHSISGCNPCYEVSLSKAFKSDFSRWSSAYVEDLFRIWVPESIVGSYDPYEKAYRIFYDKIKSVSERS